MSAGTHAAVRKFCPMDLEKRKSCRASSARMSAGFVSSIRTSLQQLLKRLTARMPRLVTQDVAAEAVAVALEELFLRAVVPVRVDADGVRAALTRELLRRLHEVVGHTRAAPIGCNGVAVQHGGMVTVRAPAPVRERVIGGLRRAAEREHGGDSALIREHMARAGRDVGAERVRVRVLALPLVDTVAAQVVARLLRDGEDGGQVVLRRGTADGRLCELRVRSRRILSSRRCSAGVGGVSRKRSGRFTSVRSRLCRVRHASISA